MSEEEIIRIQYEAIKKFSRGDRQLVLRIINELAAHIREYLVSRQPEKVSCDELCSVLENATRDWEIKFRQN